MFRKTILSALVLATIATPLALTAGVADAQEYYGRPWHDNRGWEGPPPERPTITMIMAASSPEDLLQAWSAGLSARLSKTAVLGTMHHRRARQSAGISVRRFRIDTMTGTMLRACASAPDKLGVKSQVPHNLWFRPARGSLMDAV